jgi:tryptophan 2,3-dioxygenase
MEDLNKPILPGTAPTDYERYLRTEELLALQKPRSEQVNDDELAFQVVHQSSELWLKLACADVERAIAYVDDSQFVHALRLLGRAAHCLSLVIRQTHMIEHMGPWDYHTIRRGLGHGSGFDSPGFRQVHHVSPLLGEAFTRALARDGIDLVTLYRESAAHRDLFDLAERLVEWDERVTIWKFHHLKIVERVIGGHVIGTQGTPVEVLGRRIGVSYYPELWNVRNTLTELATPRGRGDLGHGGR